MPMRITHAGSEIACPACKAAMLVPGNVPAAATPVCAGCGAAIGVDAVICTNCGRNQQTGQQLGTQAHTKSSGPDLRRTYSDSSGGASWVQDWRVWAGACGLVLVGLFAGALATPALATIYIIVSALFNLVVLVMVLVAAFKDGVGEGFLTRCVPFYALYYVFAKNDSALLKALFVMSLLSGGSRFILLARYAMQAQ